ncbi:hypothetical protein ACFQ4M_10685 [Thauera mechernichensis]|uniref:Uncharacterized protein n=1 Tax=Thauera mechernichensis TaxID=82788 RepID=A0ABW3WH04_9RHOO|nr:hypothetical protein [Thauera mechernichensis]MDG3066177.1 hypothetical protein [Thauera mechernichensis]
MKQFKHAAVALAMVGMLSAQANASEVQVQNLQAAQPIAAFSQTDIDAMFEQAGQPMQLAALSQQEMRETEGAVNPYGALLGGVGGGLGYMFSNQISGSPFSLYGFLSSVGGGAIAGSGLGAVGAIWEFNSIVSVGILDGIAGAYGW